MSRTRIKICGITTPHDAERAARAGADAIGIILHADSPRRIGVEAAREIVGAVGPFVTVVAVFADASPEFVGQNSLALSINHVQLHGHETPADVAALEGFNIVKAIRVHDRTGEELTNWESALSGMRRSHPFAILMETGGGPTLGGSGIANDWGLIERLRRDHQILRDRPLIAAGGLKPETVGDVVRRLRPFAVDVSSGVESAPGVKDERKLGAFIRAVRQADESAD